MKAMLSLLGKGWSVGTHCFIGALFSMSYWVYCLNGLCYAILYLQFKLKMTKYIFNLDLRHCLWFMVNVFTIFIIILLLWLK